MEGIESPRCLGGPGPDIEQIQDNQSTPSKICNKLEYPNKSHNHKSQVTMSGITDNAATQAHDIVEQAEVEEQKVSRGPMFAPPAPPASDY